MSLITPITQEKIRAYLEVFVEKKVEDILQRQLPRYMDPTAYLSLVSTKGRLKPFHAAIVPEEILRINAFERSFSTTLGTTFEECARLIALDHHLYAERGYDLTGKISTTALNEIERQISYFDRTGNDATSGLTLASMIDAVLAVPHSADFLVQRTVRADLYIQTKDGTELFFELKSPKPNKGQCLEVTQRILRFHALRQQNRPKVKAYFAMAYNPYGPSRDDYRWSIPKKYMPFTDGVVIGEEFWRLVGGPGTYHELLEIYQSVGKAKSKYMIDALAFGF